MKRLTSLTIGAVLVLAVAAHAQEKRPAIGSPVFVLQPGLIQSLSEGADPHFNARMVTVIPIGIPRTVLVGIVQWTPFNDPDGDGAHGNELGFVYGPVVNVVNHKYIAFDVDALFAYGPTGSVPAKSAYTHKFLVEGDLFIKLGALFNATGQWAGLSAYGMLAYIITGLDDPSPPSVTIETRDRLVALYGLSLPLAPWTP